MEVLLLGFCYLSIAYLQLAYLHHTYLQLFLLQLKKYVDTLPQKLYLSLAMKKFRIKIEHTKEYQSQYSSFLMTPCKLERLKKKLEKTLKREIWTDTGKKEYGVYPILCDSNREFVWLNPSMLEEVK